MTDDSAARGEARLPLDDAVTDDDTVPGEFGGYRVVRLLSRSTHALTAVVFASNHTRVARIFSRSCSDIDIDAAIAVYDRRASADAVLRDHVVRLDDLVTLDDGRLALIVDHVPGPALTDVLAMRGDGLELGEAVTIVAPLVDAIDAGHAVGLTGLDLHPSSVRFTAAGAPTIVRLTDAHAGPVLPDRFRALEPAYARDAASIEHLGAAVAAAVSPSERPALIAALGAAARGRSVSAALFDLAAPVPVALHAVAAHETTMREPPGAPRRTPTVENVETAVRASETAPHIVAGESHAANVVGFTSRLGTWADALIDTLRVLGLPAAVVERVQATVSRITAAGAALISAGSTAMRRPTAVVRPRFVLAGVGGAIALVAALVVTTGAPSEAQPPGAEPVVAEQTAQNTAGPAPAEQAQAAPPPQSPSASSPGLDTPLSGSPEVTVDPEPDEWPEIVGELVRRWGECRASLVAPSTEPRPATAGNVSASCTLRVAHGDSAAERLLAADDARHAILEAWQAQGGEAVVVERMGGAALIDLVMPPTSGSPSSVNASTPPTTRAASLLVVRSEAGWRVRDVLDD